MSLRTGTGHPCLASRVGQPVRQRSKHCNLGVPLGRAVAVLEQPADRNEAPPRPPRADRAAVDIGAVASEHVVKPLLVCEREGGEVVQRVALRRLGPVEDAGELVSVDEDVLSDVSAPVRAKAVRGTWTPAHRDPD